MNDGLFVIVTLCITFLDSLEPYSAQAHNMRACIDSHTTYHTFSRIRIKLSEKKDQIIIISPNITVYIVVFGSTTIGK